MIVKTDAQKAEAIRNYASHTNGSNVFFRHALCRLMVFTEGVQFLGDSCGAHWLIDAIASHLATSRLLQAEEFQLWTLSGGVGDARLACTNGNDDSPVLASQIITYTDFPKELLPFKLFLEQSDMRGKRVFCLMLPEER